ncbi:PEP-CTERM sorting domain-containing protein [Alteromonas oceani]|uniref:PEP-CTERM sorting domain-containing protein n=1 Tax=Alteromonas oceani TaxID=2071609 RepID=A0ABV7JYU7_9ALTE|nr:PEP-CTERM sorting domain-containing protein [Alteromonas oceani]
MRSLLVFVCCILATSANAGLITYSNETDFITDAGTSGTVIDFENATDVMPSFSESGVVFDTNGFESNDILLGDYAGTGSQQIYSNYFVNNLTISFLNTGINAFGTEIYSLYSASTISIDLFLSDNTIESLSIDSSDGYFGAILSGGTYVRQITMFSNSDQAEGLDNFYFTTTSVNSVPEPSTLGVLALTLAGMVFSRKRKS